MKKPLSRDQLELELDAKDHEERRDPAVCQSSSEIWFRHSGPGIVVQAFTFGDVIHLKEDIFATNFSPRVNQSSISLIAHEAIHILQFRNAGGTQPYSISYVYEWAWKLLPRGNGGAAYRDNPYEVEARDFADSIGPFLPLNSWDSR